MDITEPYYKKTIQYTIRNYSFNFKVSQDLFSSFSVDHGTQRLLRSLLFEKITTFKKALDLGSGYGTIGIFLKKICPKTEIQMVDRDALAIAYAKENVKLNEIAEGVRVYGSLGYDNVKDTNFDLIVSNIPAKVGEHVLTHILKDARFHLVRNGIVAIVVIDAINDYIYNELTTDETVKILYHKAWPGHHVYHYVFTEEAYSQKDRLASAFERGEYKRQKNTFSFQGKQYTLETTYHLPEFDQLSYDSRLLLVRLAKIYDPTDTVLVFNPGQGYIPLAVMKQFTPKKLFIVDRDLQALTISQENLVENGYSSDMFSLHHQVGISLNATHVSAIIGVLPGKQEIAVYKLFAGQILSLLGPKGYVVLSGSSTVITRFLRLIPKKLQGPVERVKNKGRSVIVLRKR